MADITPPRRWANLALFAVFLAIAVVAYGFTSTFPSPLLPGYPGSAMFPRIVLVAMGLISAFGVLRSVFGAAGATEQGRLTIPLRPFLGVVGVLVLFAALFLTLGAEIAVFSLITGCLWFRTRKILLPVAAGILSVLVVYFLFVQALSVHLPLLFLPRYMFPVT